MFSDPFLAQRAMAIASPSAGCQAIRATRDPDSEIVPDTFFALTPFFPLFDRMQCWIYLFIGFDKTNRPTNFDNH